MKKILSIIIVFAMVFSAFAFVSMSAIAEDSSKPVVDLNNGYPVDSVDQSQELYTTQTTVHSVAGYWSAQTFKPAVTGDLNRVSTLLQNSVDTTVDLYVGIYDTVGGLPNAELGYVMVNDVVVIVASAEWHTFTFSTPISLVSGIQYAIVLNVSLNNIFWKQEIP